MFIETKRLIIRTFEPLDWHSVYQYASDPYVMKYIPEGVFDEEGIKEFIKINTGEYAEKFPVILKDENTLIGHIDFHKWFGEHTI